MFVVVVVRLTVCLSVCLPSVSLSAELIVTILFIRIRFISASVSQKLDLIILAPSVPLCCLRLSIIITTQIFDPIIPSLFLLVYVGGERGNIRL